MIQLLRFGNKALPTSSRAWMIPFARTLGYRLNASEIAATAMAIAAAVVGSMRNQKSAGSLPSQFQLDQADIVIDNLIFNVPKLFLNHLLIAEHVVQLGWDGVTKVEDASTGTADSQNNDASQ
jgi:hypothetical protein